ncbi:MAG: ABC transporter permease [Bacteroidaceae bacterium]|nr:ABC transporter permease [Bacteroidaceae bacterium]
MFKHYLKTTFRNLWNGGFQTVFTIVGLAVAFFCFGICAYFVHGFLTIDNYYKNHDRVFEMRVLADEYYNTLPIYWVNPEDIMNRCPEVESFFRFSTQSPTQFIIEDDSFVMNQEMRLSGNEQYEELYAIECDTTLRHIYSPALLAGSWDAAMNSVNSMLLTEHFARKLFGSADAAIGRRFTGRLSGRTFTVRAVVEDLPPNNSLNTFIPLGCWIMNSFSDHSYVGTRVLLRQGVSVSDFNEKLADISFGGVRFKVVPPYDHKRDMGNEFYWIILLILAPGLIVLLAALGNFLHLLVSSIFKRDREYTLRKVNGARTVDLWLMVSTQVLVTMLLVGLATIVIIMLCTPLLQISLPLKLQFQFDTNVMLRQGFQHIGILLLIGLLVAWIATVRIRNNAMQPHLRTSGGHHLWRNIMMGGQMTVSFIFVTLLCAMLLQVRKNDSSVYPWFSKKEMKEILIIPPANQYKSTGVQMEQVLDALPTIREYVQSYSYDGLLTGFAVGLRLPDDSYYNTVYGINCQCTPEQLQFFGAKLLEGRWFSNADEIMVGAQLADSLELKAGEPIIVYTNSDGVKTLTVAGIIDDAKGSLGKSNYDSAGPSVYSYLTFSENAIYSGNAIYMVKCMPDKADEVRKAITEKVFGEHSEQGVQITTLYDSVQATSQVERQLMGIFWLFAGIALVISLLGIYSAVTMETTVRRKEMAIRKINGAKTRQIAALLGRFYLWLLLISAAIAFPLTYTFFHLLSSSSTIHIWEQMFNYGPLFYLSVFLIVAAFVAMTVAAQIRRIARIEPYTIVKSE